MCWPGDGHRHPGAGARHPWQPGAGQRWRNGRLFAGFATSAAMPMQRASTRRTPPRRCAGQRARTSPSATAGGRGGRIAPVLSRSLARRQVQVGTCGSTSRPARTRSLPRTRRCSRDCLVAGVADRHCPRRRHRLRLRRIRHPSAGGRTAQRTQRAATLCADPHRESLMALERSLARHAGQAPCRRA